MYLADLLDRREWRLGTDIYLPMDPASEFGYIGDAEGNPERVRSRDRILVPVFPWQQLGMDEPDILARILVEAAKANPLKLPKLSAASPKFWKPYRGLLRHPSIEVDAAIPQVSSREVPRDRVIVLTGGALPIYVMKGLRRNVFVWHRQSLLSVEFFLPA